MRATCSLCWDADLILARYGDDNVQLGVSGSYRPPWGRAALDRALMKRVAAATIRSLLENLARTIADPAPGTAAGTRSGTRLAAGGRRSLNPPASQMIRRLPLSRGEDAWKTAKIRIQVPDRGAALRRSRKP